MSGLQDSKEWQESTDWLEERQGMKYDNNKDKGWMESDSVVLGDWLIIDIVNFGHYCQFLTTVATVFAKPLQNVNLLTARKMIPLQN